MRSGELASDRRCYREVGGAGCRCSGFRESGEIAVGAFPARGSRNIFMSGVLTLLLVVMGLALLYAYRSQSPSVTPISYTQAQQAINAGQVKAVTIVGNQATMELQNGDKQRVTLPDRPDAFQKILDDYNSANPSRAIVYAYQSDSTPLTVVLSILLSLLPVLLIGGFFLVMMRRALHR
ncbi:MAG TPA: ATP-dependent metallopeptidase FtsH/Yme1/Tma family protein [Candidatus Limnocylindria bacterium]|nr:ATP-dependent metallopeptidase FtsH/Yme1/Tma family protein [Candidatus Limnocylindria bacterium]